MLNIGQILPHARCLHVPRRYQACILLFVLYLGLCHLAPAAKHFYYPLDTEGLSQYHKPAQDQSETNGFTTNLIIASVAADDTSWANKLRDRIPNLKIFRYVSDDNNAEYHPRVARGREALQYFTYLYDKYESLADVNIFVHAEEHPWHLDGALWQSMTFALSHLDLAQVLQMGYFNLYTSLRGGRPEGYNTSKTESETNVAEEPYMADAFRLNFGDDVVVPEMLLGPCCSQFAVSRDSILSRPRTQYERSMKWLMETSWPDQLTGRTWEHMWPWLFLHDQAIGRKTEWRALCRMYRVCFNDAEDLEHYQALWDERARLLEMVGFGRELLMPWSVRHTRQRLGQLAQSLEEKLLTALEQGNDASRRYEAGLNMTAP